MKKLLYIASSSGHILSFHVPYILEFKRLGWEVHVAFGGVDTVITGADRSIALPIEKRYISVNNIKACSVLHRLMAEQEYDLVIPHTSLASFYTRLAEIGLKNRPETIIVVHGYLFGPHAGLLKNLVLEAAEYMMLPQTDCIVTMNEWDMQWVKKHFPHKKQRFIHGMGVDANRYGDMHRSGSAESGHNDFVMAYAAEFSNRKNQQFLINAMGRLPENIRLILPGTGDNLDICRKLADENGVSDRVIIPGYVEDIGSVLASADAAVTSSHSEGLPFNVMEAMLAGLPVVASDVKGNNDLVKDGINGFLYPDGDTDAFVSAVMKLYSDSTLCSRMGDQGMIIMEQYKLDAVLPEVMDVYLDRL